MYLDIVNLHRKLGATDIAIISSIVYLTWISLPLWFSGLHDRGPGFKSQIGSSSVVEYFCQEILTNNSELGARRACKAVYPVS
ncbi:unnamed protein product, partial [Brenthis ino]